MAKKKHPKDMTSDELVRHLFHPKIVKHLKQIVQELDEKAEKPKKSRKKTPTKEV